MEVDSSNPNHNISLGLLSEQERGGERGRKGRRGKEEGGRRKRGREGGEREHEPVSHPSLRPAKDT